MKTKTTIFALMLVLSSAISQQSFSQVSFSHSLGAAVYMGGGASAPGAMYSPRLNFLELGKEMTISAGTHLGLGIMYNSQEGAGSFALDLPIVAEINIGHGANPDTRSSFGFFGGAGFGISKIGSAGTFSDDYNDAMGPLFNAGIRAIIRDRACGARVSYLLNMKEGYENTIGLGVFYTFGDF